MMTTRPPIWVALRAHLAADRRKTAVMAVLLVVMVGVYARLFYKSPAKAEAGTAATAATTAAAPAPTQANQSVSAAPMRVRPKRPLVRDLDRDPFAVRLERFPVDPTAVTAAPAGTPTASPIMSTTPEPAPAPQQGFRLQSTICGTLPMAWINGRCIQPGESIDGYVLEQVEPARVVLRRGDEVVVLTME